MQSNKIDNKFKDYLLVNYKRKFWPAELTIKFKKGIDIDPEKKRRIKSRYKIKKVLIDKSSQVYKNVIKPGNEFYRYLVGTPDLPGMTVPFEFDGVYLLLKDDADAAWKKYEELKAEMITTRNTFKDNLPTLIETARSEFFILNSQLFKDTTLQTYFETDFDVGDYPRVESIDSLFDMSLCFTEIDTPQDIDEAVKQKNTQEFEKLFQETQEKIIETFITKFVKCIENLKDRCESSDTLHKAKEASLENPREFCNKIKTHLNVLDNPSLIALADECDKYLASVKSVKSLKDDEKLRAKMYSDMDKIQDKLEDLFEELPSRQFII